MNAPILAAKDLSIVFRGPGLWVRALQGVDMEFHKGQIVGLIGPSGCGKSTLARALAGLVAPTAGGILFEGRPLTDMSSPERRIFHRKVQIVFQDPYLSLNSRHTVLRILEQPLQVHRLAKGNEAIRRRVEELLHGVRLGPEIMRRYPGELSGGQRQRINIARALSMAPDLIILDEPVSALDTVTAQEILDLLRQLHRERSLAYLFISHDMGAVRQIAPEVAVMAKGQIVEVGPINRVLAAPTDPSTRQLVESARLPLSSAIASHLAQGDLTGQPP